MALRYATIRAAGNLSVAPTDGSAQLWTVNVNTGAASATLSIYDGTSASGTLIAVVDCENPGSYGYGVLCPNGIFAVLADGDADVTIGYQ